MSIKNVTIYTTTNAAALSQNVQAELNAVIAQINNQTGTLANDLNANQNRVTNVGQPGNAGDAVNLGYMENAINTMSQNMFKILNRRTPDAYLNAPSGTAGASSTYTIIFKAAEAQNGNPILGMSFPSSTAPSGTVISGAHVLWGAEVFQGGTYVQDRFPLPPNFTALSSVVVYWASPSGTANPTWQLSLVDIAPGSNIDQSYTVAGSVTGTATSSLYLVTNTIGNGYSGLTAGHLCYFHFGRSDGLSDNAGLLELQFNLSHD